MIQLIEAPPRSGKSYMAVYYLCKFTKYDAIYNEYVLSPHVLIISNIEGLKIKHWRLDECLKKKPLKEFFTIANFESIMSKMNKTHVIIAIDECHEFFPAGFNDDELYKFFAFHGHIGLDVILMTQSLTATSRMFNPLLEYLVQVKPRTRALLNTFSYDYVTKNGKYLYSKTLQKRKEVFNAYKSFRHDEQNKPKNAVRHWAVVVLVLFLAAGLLFKTALAVVKGKSDNGKKSTAVAAARLQSPVAPAAASVPAPVPAAVPVAPAAPVAPVQSNVSSARRSAPAGEYVTGKASSGRHVWYYLSSGRMVRSSKYYNTGDMFKE